MPTDFSDEIENENFEINDDFFERCRKYCKEYEMVTGFFHKTAKETIQLVRHYKTFEKIIKIQDYKIKCITFNELIEILSCN